MPVPASACCVSARFSPGCFCPLPPVAAAEVADFRQLDLRRVDVRGLQSGRSLVTVVGENPMRFQEQRGHFWHVATPTLIERSLLTAFNDASSDLVFGTADSLDKPDFRLIVTVTRFAYDPAGEAMVNFDATVTASDGDVLLARSYWGRAPLADATPAGGVNAIGAALGEAMTVFSRELADVL